jgi:murein DD-endopeptidase MepM/ murein hydrolase activator NlpD
VTCGAQHRHSTTHTAKHTTKHSAKSNQLKRKLADIERKKAVAKHELAVTKHQVSKVADDIYAVDQQIGETTDRLAQTTNQLSDDRLRQKLLHKSLKAAQARLVLDKVLMRKRLRAMYMEGDAPLITVVLGTQSGGDLASREYLVQRIASADSATLHEFERTRNLISRREHEVDDIVVRIASLAQDQQAQRENLKGQREKKADILSDLKDKKDQLEELVDQFEADENSIASQIRAAERVIGPTHVATHFSGRLLRPVIAPITSGFGMRFHPILHVNKLHAGIDFGAARGTPIHAAADGIVINSTVMRGFGNVVIIDHGGGIATVYGHCSLRLVVTGQRVHRGQVIAKVGSTGLATGPHLHFEVHVNGRAVDPRGWL